MHHWQIISLHLFICFQFGTFRPQDQNLQQQQQQQRHYYPYPPPPPPPNSPSPPYPPPPKPQVNRFQLHARPESPFHNKPGYQPWYPGKTEIVDVSPEAQRQIIGLPENENGNCMDPDCQGKQSVRHQPRYIVKVDSKTTNKTDIPFNITKPIIKVQKFITSIRRTFVYDPARPGTIIPIDIHLVNGAPVTTTLPPTTTANEEVRGITSWYQDNQR